MLDIELSVVLSIAVYMRVIDVIGFCRLLLSTCLKYVYINDVNSLTMLMPSLLESG